MHTPKKKNDEISDYLENLVGPEEAAALQLVDAALVVVLELLEIVDGEFVPLGGLLVQVLGNRHPLLRLLGHDGELEPLVVAQQSQHARGHLVHGRKGKKNKLKIDFKR